VAATIVQYLGTGRRKTSVARVFLRPGKGEIKVNNRAFDNYSPTESARAMVRQPLAATETMEKFDLLILATQHARHSGRQRACVTLHAGSGLPDEDMAPFRARRASTGRA